MKPALSSCQRGCCTVARAHLNPTGIGAAVGELSTHRVDTGHSTPEDVACDVVTAYLEHDPLHRLLREIWNSEHSHRSERHLLLELLTKTGEIYD